MIRTFLLLTTVVLGLSCKPDKDTFIIQGKLEGLQDEFIYLIYPGESEEELDTIEVKNGKFRIEGKVSTPDLYYLSIPSKEEAVEIFVEPGKFVVSGNIEDPLSWKVKGGALQTMYDEYRAIVLPVYQKYKDLFLEFQTLKLAGDIQKIEVVEGQMDVIKMDYYEKTMLFVEQHPVNMVSAHLIARELLFNPDFERLDPILAKMDSTVKASKYAALINKNLEAARKTAPGVTAPDFTMPDMEGNQISLSFFRGKFVLIDFWASWCGPCRKENPRMLSIYSKYKGTRFEMLGVSVDKDKAQWKKAVVEDALVWTQVIDERDVSSIDYGVVGIPSNVLVSPDGKVIARNIFGKELEAKLTEVLAAPKSL